jgi:hypothetical protein
MGYVAVVGDGGREIKRVCARVGNAGVEIVGDTAMTPGTKGVFASWHGEASVANHLFWTRIHWRKILLCQLKRHQKLVEIRLFSVYRQQQPQARRSPTQPHDLQATHLWVRA